MKMANMTRLGINKINAEWPLYTDGKTLEQVQMNTLEGHYLTTNCAKLHLKRTNSG